jgi:phosphoribosylformylglycinamidine cyclo-ligase
MSKALTYAQSGVDIEANDVMVDRIQSHLASTYGPRVINVPWGFAGLFRLDYDEKLFKKNYRNPVLVACTDGVGSKVQVAAKAKKFDTVGIDLVAMSVNDMLVMGAEPLFFLDYVALHKLEPDLVAQMVKGVATGCREADCALLGGETAEMPDTYRKGDFDMAGFAVGVVEKNRIIAGKSVKPGDIILGLGSSGLHSNGYALARAVCFKHARLKLTDVLDELNGTTLGEALLAPTRIYVRPILKLIAKYRVKRVVHAMAHITGNGLPGNIPRILPPDCNAVIRRSSWPRPKIFNFLQRTGPVAEEEMFRVFNMGIGYVVIAAPDFAEAAARSLIQWGQKVYNIGRITRGTGQVALKD